MILARIGRVLALSVHFLADRVVCYSDRKRGEVVGGASVVAR